MTTELLTRTFDGELELRSSNNGGDGRTVFGRAVPYGVPQYIYDGLTEEFVRGCFDHQLRAANRIRTAREHVQLGGTLIGAVRSLDDRNDGLWFEARVSRTPTGDETLELINDGALRQTSIGFRERPHGNKRTSNNVIQRTAADLFEIAFVMEGAYGEQAEIAGVRSARAIDPRVAAAHGCTCCNELAELRGAQRDVTAQRLTLPALPALPTLRKLS
ncbi:HK97 family phage prohead protease [Brevundimonas sp.]|uniref:HK97 family phage prohead protease n=1 Tax=Brevundimonas sp. TaxID=1871086 RepID=UPI002D4E59BD|nr:HK97 family phage prohead protease [Brevundimonas sp.]HYD28875.1 HK97 family phage prohead protease [Brevundimonas sp.]